MPTATAEKVRFEARCSDQILTRIPARHIDNGIGGKIVLTEEEYKARQLEKGEEVSETPWKVQFVKGVFETDDPVLIKWLRNHKCLGANEPSGFYEVAPNAEDLEPSITEQLRAIGRAEANANPDAGLEELADILVDEKETHNRPTVIQASEDAMRVIEEEPPESGADAGETNGDSQSTSTPSPTG